MTAPVPADGGETFAELRTVATLQDELTQAYREIGRLQLQVADLDSLRRENEMLRSRMLTVDRVLRGVQRMLQGEYVNFNRDLAARDGGVNPS